MADETTTPSEEETKAAEEVTTEETTDTGAETKTDDSKSEEESKGSSSTEERSKEEQTKEESTDDSFDYEAWLEKKGIDPSTPEGKAQVAKSWRELEKKMHADGEKAAALRKQAEKQAEESAPEGEDESTTQTRQLLNKLAVTDFYLNNPEARQYDAKMAEVLADKPYLSNDLDTLYLIAKATTSDEQLLEAEKKGKKEALKSASQSQRQGSPSMSATTKSVSEKEDPILEGLKKGFDS